ncbi:MAG: hypothetical protein HYT73_04575 [Candidatus Aenigmarchaeota archaeon]|nr:hypothetical protein [Candidatus Aenigmarchaeota archaeon]
MEIIQYIGKVLGERRMKREGVSQQYERAYRRCFEGTPEQMARRLDAWDYVHSMTRP